jgi:hypothetical protein
VGSFERRASVSGNRCFPKKSFFIQSCTGVFYKPYHGGGTYLSCPGAGILNFFPSSLWYDKRLRNLGIDGFGYFGIYGVDIIRKYFFLIPQYLNRLSDVLFVHARYTEFMETEKTEWPTPRKW